MKILVIDDDDISFLIIQRCFYEAGLQPAWTQARDAAGAIRSLREYTTDLVLPEPMLAGISSGYNSVFQAAAGTGIFTHTRVCALATFLLDELDNLGKGYNVFKRFTKPFCKSCVEQILPRPKLVNDRIICNLQMWYAYQPIPA